MGQANYAAGNTHQDTLVCYRVSRGEKAVALDLGKVESIGYVTEKVMDATFAFIYATIHEKQLLAVLDYYCNPEVASLPSSDAKVILGIENPHKAAAYG